MLDEADDGVTKQDRRRSGRVEVDPALISLLRGTAPFIEPLPVRESADPAQSIDGLDDGGDPARGIMIALLLCAPFWAIAWGLVLRLF